MPTICVQYKHISLSMSTVTNDSSTFAWYGWVVSLGVQDAALMVVQTEGEVG